MNISKKKYRELCEKEDIPIFSQYYWMDAVCGEENWNVILIEEGGKIIASLPYFYIKENGKFKIQKALLTQNNGIKFYYPSDLKLSSKVSFENRAIEKVILELEKLEISEYRQYYHYDFKNWLPFYWQGYKQTTRYTYIIENKESLNTIYENFDGNVRKHIKKAQKSVIVKSDLDYKKFYELNKETYARQGIDIPYSFQIFEKIYKTLKERELVKSFYAEDEFGNIHSAVLYVLDKNSIYYLMSGSKMEFRNSQSLTLLIYEGIKLAHKLNKTFDFEGSMKKNIEKFFRQFGAEQKMYFDISKKF